MLLRQQSAVAAAVETYRETLGQSELPLVIIYTTYALQP
jgi:hypothetical protein